MWDIIITIFCIIVLVCIWVMLYDSNRFVIRKYVYRDKRLRRKARIVILSDLHNKRYGKDNEQLLHAIRECAPDFILVAGDLLTAKPGKTLDIAVHVLEELTKEFPIYYGNGNHEHRLKLYPEQYGDMAECYAEELKRLGVVSLVNCHTRLEEYGISIYGSEIDRFYYKRFKIQHMEPNYLAGILGQPAEDTYNILLAHNPDYFPQYAGWGADLVCSGHVHGGMVRVPIWGKGVVSPNIRLFPKYDGGEFKEGKTTMLLSRGLGMHTIPIRLFNPGEVLLVELEPEESGI